MTNGEKLRSLTDDDLAEKVYMIGRYECPMEFLAPHACHQCGDDESCMDCIKRWLKEEYEWWEHYT